MLPARGGGRIDTPSAHAPLFHPPVGDARITPPDLRKRAREHDPRSAFMSRSWSFARLCEPSLTRPRWTTSTSVGGRCPYARFRPGEASVYMPAPGARADRPQRRLSAPTPDASIHARLSRNRTERWRNGGTVRTEDRGREPGTSADADVLRAVCLSRRRDRGDSGWALHGARAGPAYPDATVATRPLNAGARGPYRSGQRCGAQHPSRGCPARRGTS
jgi:hypothetical protein